MRLSAILMCGILATCAVGATAYGSAAPAGAQAQPNLAVEISRDVFPSENYPPCPIKVVFHAVVRVQNWHAGMADFPITYHWESGTKKFTEHTMTTSGGQAEAHVLTYHKAHGFRGSVRFMITKPVKLGDEGDEEDIICHSP